MKKQKLKAAVSEKKSEIKTALETVYNALNQGQQKKIIKNESVKNLFDTYGVEY